MKKKDSETIHYILTFITILAALIFFATHLITGKPALLQLDSLAGSLLIGIVFIAYLFWLAYDDTVSSDLTLVQSVVNTLKQNTTSKFVFVYWLVLILIPFACNLFI